MTSCSANSVAIIIAAYNAADTIARAVGSALVQREVTEVCVVDDASGDDTVARARACDDGSGRLTVLRQASNGGPSAARERAISATKSAWIGILDADDFLTPGRVGRLLAFADRADFIADEIIRIPAEAPDRREITRWRASDEDWRVIDFETFIHGNLGRGGTHRLDYGFAKPLMRRAFLDAHAIAYRRDMRLGEDYELYARALAHGARFLITEAFGYHSVVRRDSLSNRHRIEDLVRLRNCDDEIAKIRSFTRGERRALHEHRLSVDKRVQWRILIEAFKARDVRRAAETFNSLPVGGYLLTRLAEQAIVRTFSRLTGTRQQSLASYAAALIAGGPL